MARRVVAFLQNQWFPQRQHKYLDYAYSKCETPEERAELNTRYLFFRCLTGRRLRSFLMDLCDDIVWENAARGFGNEASSVIPADPEHMAAVVNHFDPAVVVLFGKQAEVGWARLSEVDRIVVRRCCHPAARGTRAMHELTALNTLLRSDIMEAR